MQKKRKESKHNVKDSHQITREERKRRRNEENYKNNQSRINKMAMSTYISITTLNVNGLNAPVKSEKKKDIEWLNGYKNKTHIYAAYKRLTSEMITHTD